MNKNDLNISDLEKYTFSKYLDGIHGLENFSQINSFTNNFIVNYNPLNPVHNFNRENNINNNIINNKQKIQSNSKDINYNQLNIIHYNKSPIKNKYNNINNINNINIISQDKYQQNHIKNYNNINKININRMKRNSFSKDNIYERKRKYRTPDKIFNYNKFNYITSNDSDNKINLYNNIDSKNDYIINYNSNIKHKLNRKLNKRALTPDNNYSKKNRRTANNYMHRNLNIQPIYYNNNINLMKQNADTCSLKSKNNHSFKDSSLSQYTFNDTNNENNISNIKAYNYKNNQKTRINDKMLYLDNISSKENNQSDYNESCFNFNSRLPRGSKIPLIDKNLLRSVIYNNYKTPSPPRKNNNYLSTAIYNSKNKKYLKYKRSISSEPNIKKKNNKLKYNYFKFKYLNEDSSSNNSYSKKTKENSYINSCMNKKSNKIFKNINNSCVYFNSSLYNNDKSGSYSNENKYNMTQPDFSKSLYNIYMSNSENYNNINKLFNQDGANSIKNINENNNNQHNKNSYYKYLKLDSKNDNHKSYMELYNSSIKENSNNKNDSLKCYNNIDKRYNFEKNLNLNTKLSTNNNTYENSNSNNTNSLYYKEIKNNKKVNSNTIEEVHINFVNILQNSKNMIELQENSIRDKILYNNIHSTTIIIEERDIE